MRSESIQQFAIVKEDSAVIFEEKLNARIKELKHNHPVVTFNESDPFYARICFTETTSIPEDIMDVYELGGIKFRCEDCPAFEPILNKDDTENRRVRYGNCEFSRMGRTFKDSVCCEHLFQMIESGRIGLCWQK